MRKFSKGFTLIELLVVIAIIGVLAGSLFVIVNPIQQFKKARDTQRRNTLKVLQTAIEQYYNDKGSYPNTGTVFYSSEPSNGPGTQYMADWIPGLVAGGYIKTLPKDPVGGNSKHPNPACAGYKSAYLYVSNVSLEEHLLR